MKNPDIAILIDMYSDNFPPPAFVHALGNGRPAFHEAIWIGELSWFGVSGLLGVRHSSKDGDRKRAGYESKSRSTCT
jgi:hypothetical protein